MRLVGNPRKVSQPLSRKSINTLIPDVQALFDGHALSRGVLKFSDQLGRIFVDRFQRYAEDREPGLRMSNIGRPLRQLWYDIHRPSEDKLPPDIKLKFLYGDVIETLMLFLAQEAGHAVERCQEEIKVDGIVGHIDAVIDGVLVDVKSASTRSFEKFKNGSLFTDDPFGYVAQLSGYRQAIGTERACFWAVDKTLGHQCLLFLKDEDENGYDVSARIAEVRKAIASDIEPARCFSDRPPSKTDKSGNMVLSVGCSYCPHKHHCWRDANEGRGLIAYSYSTGPKFFTHVAKEPRVKRATKGLPDSETVSRAVSEFPVK